MRLRQILPAILTIPFVMGASFSARAEDAKATAEVKVGTGIEKMEIQGEAKAFTVEAGTKIHVWAKVTGAAESSVTVVFSKADKTFRQELKVPRSPYRTYAYRTFRKGDEGNWTAQVVGADGSELGSASFTVEVR